MESPEKTDPGELESSLVISVAIFIFPQQDIVLDGNGKVVKCSSSVWGGRIWPT